MPDLVDKVLGYVDRPWKIGAAVVLVVVGVVAYIVYENRAAIAQRILASYVTPTCRSVGSRISPRGS
jgi:hypothetical protein